MNKEIQKYIDAESFASLGLESIHAHELAHEWSGLVYNDLKEREEELMGVKPRQLDSMEVNVNSRLFRIYGVVHGWIGGGSQTYRDFVRDAIEEEPELISEKMLGKIYLGGQQIEIPDFVMLRRAGQLFLGFKSMLLWPMFIFYALMEMGREFFTKEEPERVELEKVFESVCYHNIDPEYRRAIGESLPTRLQIEYEMKYWRSWRRYTDDELLFAIVPRSAYMAEFARSWAEAKSVDEVAVLVGDRHLTEVEYFLKHPVEDDWIKRKAASHARAIAKFRGAYHLLFGVYFTTLLLGAAIGALPWLILAVILTNIF